MYWDKTGKEITLNEWVALRRDDVYRTVRREDVAGYQVVTVWMGLDQLDELDSDPYIFGSMVYDRSTETFWDSEELFARNEEEALDNHAELKALCEAKVS